MKHLIKKNAKRRKKSFKTELPDMEEELKILLIPKDP